MSVQTQSDSALGRFEAEVSHTFLARCAGCHSPHPAALGHADTSKCHNCGEPSANGVTRTEASIGYFNNPLLLIGQACLMMAASCRRFIERLDK